MVARNRGQTLGKTVAHQHVQSDGMHKFFNFGRHGSTRRGEEMWILKPDLLTHQAENGFIHHLILQSQSQRGALTATEAFHIVFLSHTQSMVEKLLLKTIGTVHLVAHCNENFLPETRNTRHARGMCLDRKSTR